MFKNCKENKPFYCYICFDETISNSLEIVCFWNNFKTFISRLKYWFSQNTFINHLYIIYNDQYWLLFCSMSYRTVFFKLQVMPLKWVMKSTEKRFLNKIKEKRTYHSTLHSSVYKSECIMCVLVSDAEDISFHESQPKQFKKPFL